MNPQLIDRPRRWDTPFGPDQSERLVDELLGGEPFASMSPESFPDSLPLRGILRNDCRMVTCEDGELIFRQGDYGNSAFLLLSGQVAVVLKTIPGNILGRHEPRRKSLLAALGQLWRDPSIPEQRNYGPSGSSNTARGADHSIPPPPKIFLQDIPRLIGADDSVMLEPGELFGELSALTRTPRSATVFASGSARMLEIRWQGLRDLMRFDRNLKGHVERLYRKHSLQTHLRELPFFQDLPASVFSTIAQAAVFESYGNFEWHNKFRDTRQEDIAERILSEPSVAERGEYVNGLLLIRNGFARVCRREESGYRTVAYLGKGETFGWRELAHTWQTQKPVPWQLSLRAVGYLDVIRIPSRVVEEHVFPSIPQKKLPALLPTDRSETKGEGERRLETRPAPLETTMLEFLVEERLINGTKAMLIDLDRCTRCDDCVRACAATHDGNPRFVRDGIRHDHYLIANACMHCADPICMIGCPTGAISRHSLDGVVTINDGTCIGCSTCANSCPYGNIRMVEVHDAEGNPYVDRERHLPIVKATKCDLCVDQPGGPACQRACPHDALVRIDLTTADSIKAFIQP